MHRSDCRRSGGSTLLRSATKLYTLLCSAACPVLSSVALTTIGAMGPAHADYTNGLSTQEQRFYDYGPGGSNGSPKAGSILDSTNPIDLMNKIRRGTAMDDATPPASAIDQALQQFEVQAAPAPAVAAPASAASAAAGGVSAAPSRPLAPPPMGTPAATPQSQSGSTTLRPAL